MSKTWVVEIGLYLTEYSLRRFWQFKKSEAERARCSSVLVSLYNYWCWKTILPRVELVSTSIGFTKNPKQASKQRGKRSSTYISSAVGSHTVRNRSGMEAGRAWPHQLRHSTGQLQLTAAHLAQDHFTAPVWWTGNTAVKQLILTKASALKKQLNTPNILEPIPIP